MYTNDSLRENTIILTEGHIKTLKDNRKKRYQYPKLCKDIFDMFI